MQIAGFALGFIFLSPPFSPIESGFWAFFAKSLLSLTPLILVDFSTHIDAIRMEQSILYLKQLTVFKLMYICT